jgi:hypothetical protein
MAPELAIQKLQAGKVVLLDLCTTFAADAQVYIGG